MQEMEKYFLIIIWGTIFLVLLITMSIVFLFQYQKKHKRFIEQKNNFTQTLLQSQLEIQEKTLKNISQEIHDNIGQVLSLVKLNLYTMDVTDNESLLTKIDNSKELVSKAIIDLRDLSHSMNTDYIEEKGLVKAIEYELEMIKKTGVSDVKYSILGTAIRLDKHKELITFRIVQEALQNIIKHANAKNIFIELHFLSNCVKLSVKDDGLGFENENYKVKKDSYGIGISNMFKKAEMINAELLIESSLKNGTTISMTIKSLHAR